MRWGRGVPKAHVRARRSETKDALKARLKEATTDDDRRATRTLLAKMTDKIRKEKDAAQGNYVLQYLREGGWAARDVAAPLPPMPYDQEPKQEKACDPVTIASRAATCYSALFSDPGEDDAEVNNLIRRRSTDWHNDDAVVSTEDVRRATMALARGKTTGTDRPPARPGKQPC